MHLFLIGWNLSKERYALALGELRNMTEVYPHLCPETLWHRESPGGALLVAGMHTDSAAAHPRQYALQDEHRVLFYSGLPVHPTAAFPAYRAEALSARWDRLTEELDGQYFIARASLDSERIELLTDFLGREQVFYFQQGETWLIGNSVRLIQRVAGAMPLDPLGMSLFLTFGWMGADRTLRSCIRTLPPGQRWSFRAGDAEPVRRSHYPPSRLARRPYQALTPAYLQRLAGELTGLCSSVGQAFEGAHMRCGLTGGRDTRLIAAMLKRAGLPMWYFTHGAPDAPDVRIGQRVARTLDVSHQVVPIAAAVTDDWPRACRQGVTKNDGMVSLQMLLPRAGLAERNGPRDPLGLTFWGGGGAIARGFYSRPHLFENGSDRGYVERYLSRLLIRDHQGLVRQDAVKLVRDYVHQFVTQSIDDGFAPIDIPDAFHTYQRPALNLWYMRWHLHLERALRQLRTPRKENAWPRMGWLWAKREEIRHLCLDQTDSILWQFVDRTIFQRVTSGDAVLTGAYKDALYCIATLFYYNLYDTEYQKVVTVRSPAPDQDLALEPSVALLG